MKDNYERWKFGTDNDKLVELVLKGEKRATTSLYSEYLNDNEELPKVGDRSIILFDDGRDACLIEDVEVIVTEFKNITEDLAFIEGEGDKSLDYYRKEHIRIFKNIDSSFDNDSKVVFEIFKVIKKYNLDESSQIKENTSMFDKIRSSCFTVMENNPYVKINYDRLDEFIKEIKCDNLENWLLYNPYNLLDLGIEKIINFLLFFEAIDYSFWGSIKWSIETDDGIKDGSDALLYAMLKYVRGSGKVDFGDLSLDEFKKILKGNVEIPLLEERYRTIVQISGIVKKKMNGNFYNYIKDIRDDISLFEVIVNNFSSFKDERLYEDKTIYFYKLAQLLTSDILHVRERLEKIEVDCSHLIGCADYKIPQTLRALKIISYSSELSELVDQKCEIEVSSLYEVSIRASQLVVTDYIKNKLDNFDSIDINDFLFLYSKKVKNIVKPYHLCRNVNY